MDSAPVVERVEPEHSLPHTVSGFSIKPAKWWFGCAGCFADKTDMLIKYSLIYKCLSLDEIKTLDGLVIGDYNTLKLVGLTGNDEPFVGTTEIMVVDIDPKGKN